MTVSIVSGIEIYAGPLDIVTSIQAPNIPGGGAISIGDVVGLQAALDLKLDDAIGTIGPVPTAVTITGAELNFLSGLTQNVETALTGKVDVAGDTMTGSLLFGIGIQLLIDAGLVGAPGLAVVGDLDTGLWSSAGDNLDFAVGGLNALNIAPSGALSVPVGYEALVTADTVIPNKKYVDDEIAAAIGGPFLPLAGGAMTGDIELDGVARLRLDADDDTFLEALVDDTMNLWIGGSVGFTFDAACLDVATKTIKNVVDPVNPQDAATMNYVDTEIVALNLGGTGPFLQLAGGTMAGNIDMDGNGIVDLVDPTNPQDAATMNYVDTEIVALNLGGTGPFLQLAGGTMTGAIDMGANLINNAADPVAAQDVVTLAYADANYVGLGGATGPLGGDLDAGGNNIINLADPVNPQDAATMNWVDSNFLDLAGTSAMTGALDMGGNLITNLAAATAADEAVNLGQANSLYLRLDGTSTMTGDLNAGGNQINAVADPTLAQDAATKNYVDSNFLDLLGTSVMLGTLDMGGFDIDNLLDPTTAQQAATKNYVDTEITALNLTSTFVEAAGDTMTGALTMDTAAQIRADDGSLGAPSYAFDSAADTGMWWDTTNIRLSLGGSSALTVAPAEVDVHGKVVTGVANPSADDDAVNLGTLNALGAVRLLGSSGPINLLATGLHSIYTVPVGAMHIITHIIVRTDTYTPGAAPTNPEASVGLNGSYNQIVDDNTELDWGGTAGAGDQAVYLAPRDGSPTPNAGDIVRFQVDTAGGGTFSALTATVYVLGIEL